MTTWAEAAAEYIDKEGRRLAPSTAKAYASALRTSGLILGPNKSMKRLTQDDLEDMLWGRENSLVTRGLKPNVINARKLQIGTFLKWCLYRGYIKKDLTYGLKHKKLPAQKRIARQLGAELLLDALDAAPNPRDRIMLALATFTGSRISEIKLFQVKHVDLLRNELEGVIPKTTKHFRARMCPELRAEMDVWLAHYARDCGYLSAEAMVADARRRNLDWFLVPRLTRPIMAGYKTVDTSQRKVMPEEGIENVYTMVRKVFAQIGIEDAKGEGFHTLRRSAARMMYERACERESSKDRAMRLVQLYLNHSSLQVTEKYVGTSVEQAALDEMLGETPLLGSAYAERYGQAADGGNVVQFRRREVS